MKANLRALCLYVCIKTRSAAPSHGDEVALSCVPSHAIVTSRPALVQVPAKVRVVSTRSSSNSRRQCYWSQHHHITGMKLLLLGQWLTRTIGDIPHRILPSGAQEGGSLSQQTEGQAAAFYRMMMSSRSMFCCVLIPHAHLM